MRVGAIALSLAVLTGVAMAETASNGVLTIDTGDAVLTFEVEIADEPDERSQGLMYRDALNEQAGMLFIYPSPRIASFWMKNTKIPLDMIFIDPDGEIVGIAEETTPFSLTPVISEELVIGVLEIEGGHAGKLGIEAGDRVEWQVISTEK